MENVSRRALQQSSVRKTHYERPFTKKNQADDLCLAAALPPFVRRQRCDRQRVNFVANKRTKALVDQLVAREQSFPVKLRCDNESAIMGVVVALHLYDRIAEPGFD